MFKITEIQPEIMGQIIGGKATGHQTTTPPIKENKPFFTYESEFSKQRKELENLTFPKTREIASPKTVKLDAPTKQNTIAGYNFSKYASSLDAIPVMKSIYDQTGNVSKPELLQKEVERLKKVAGKITVVTGELIHNSAKKYGVDPKMLLAVIRKETSLGMNLKSKNNFGNILNTDDGKKKDYSTPQEGMDAVARELQRREVGSL